MKLQFRLRSTTELVSCSETPISEAQRTEIGLSELSCISRVMRLKFRERSELKLGKSNYPTWRGEQSRIETVS